QLVEHADRIANRQVERSPLAAIGLGQGRHRRGRVQHLNRRRIEGRDSRTALDAWIEDGAVAEDGEAHDESPLLFFVERVLRGGLELVDPALEAVEIIVAGSLKRAVADRAVARAMGAGAETTRAAGSAAGAWRLGRWDRGGSRGDLDRAIGRRLRRCRCG